MTANAGVGLTYMFDQSFGLTLKAKRKVFSRDASDLISQLPTDGDYVNQFLFGFSYAFGNGDSDRDGVKDDVDACVNTPGLPELNGCPDDDGDGVSNANDACPETPANEESNGLGCSESQIREEFQAEEITSLHYSIEMYNLTHGVMEEERYLNTNDSNYIRYQLWRLVEIYNVHNTYNSNISSIAKSCAAEARVKFREIAPPVNNNSKTNK